MSAPSPYALAGPRLVEMGYSAIPIEPGTKRPAYLVGDAWVGMFDWRDRFSQRLPTTFETDFWSSMPGAGVGLVVGPAGVVGIDIDVDDKPILAAIEAVLSYTPVRKAGAKGVTLFFRSTTAPSASFNEYLPDGRRGRRLCDIIGMGRQTVLPPSIHPDTGQPYRWTGEEALDRVRPEDLPELPADIVERLAEALKPFGYQPDRMSDAASVDLSTMDHDKPHRMLNDMAMSNLHAWVPKLGLYKLKAYGGGYRCVATWRSSHSGRPLEQRQPNLKIHPTGIRDFHDDRTYTPLDLVKEALVCDLPEAYEKLSGFLGLIPEPIVLNPSGPRVEVRDGIKIDADTGEVLEDAPQSSTDLRDFPDEHLRVPGLVGDIADWIMATSPRPIRLFATAAALVTVGTLVGRRVYCGLPRSGTNLYLMAIAGTGAGKERPQEAVRQLLSATTSATLYAGAPSSSASLAMGLLRRPLQVQIVDEVDKILRRVGGRNASSQEAQLVQDYCTLFGRGLGVFMPDTTTSRGDIPITRPALSFFGATTFHSFYEHLKSGMIVNGFLNRFLILPRHQRVAANPAMLPEEIIPDALLADLKALFGFQDEAPPGTDPRRYIAPSATLMDPDRPPAPFFVDMTARADDIYRECRARDERMLAQSDQDPIYQSWARGADITKRVATIVACGHFVDSGLRGMAVDEEDMVFAARLVDWAFGNLVDGIRENMVESDHQANYKLVLRIIGNTGWVPRAEVYRKVHGRFEKRVLDGLIDQMREAGVIEVGEEKTAGRPKMLYRKAF